MKRSAISLLLVGIVAPIFGATGPTDYRDDMIQQLVAGDPSFVKFPVQFRFSAPEYAFVKETPPLVGKRVQKVVLYEFANDRNRDGFLSTGYGFAIVDGGKVTFVDTSKEEIEWIFGKPALEPKIYYSGINSKEVLGRSILKTLPNQLPDPTSPSVTPPAGAGGAPSVAADH
jgi:hypothetical protein